MLQLHDKTRCRVCIAGFFILGVLPAFFVGGWCLARHLPGGKQAEADRLGRQLGMTVKLDGWEHLRPGVVLYKGLELADPETDQTILRCRLLEVNRRWSDEQRQPTLTLIASQPELPSAAIGKAWCWLQRLLENQLGRLDSDLQFSATELTLRADNHSQTLTDVAAALENLPGGTHAQIRFRLIGAKTPEPARIRIVRNRQVSPPTSGFELYTGGGELPCSVLAMGLSELKPLGPQCRFRGYIWASETPDGWEGEVTGQLVELDFGRLITGHFPHHLSGIGEATIQRARFRHGRLEEGSGILAVGPGTIDRSLVAAAVDRLGLVADANLPSSSREKGLRVAYQELALSVTLDTRGLRLRGRCNVAEPGTILSNGQNRLLGEPLQESQSVSALVRTLVPQSAVQVPASRQTDWLLRHLPVPKVMPILGTEAVPPTARLRLPETWQR